MAPAPRLAPLAVRSAALGGTTRGGGLRHHLAVDHRQAVAGLLVHADGLLRALVAVGHVVAHGLVLRAQRDAAAGLAAHAHRVGARSEEHTSELQSLMRISYAVFCLKKKKQKN